MTSPPGLTDAVTVRPADVADIDTLLELHRRAFDSDWSLVDWRHRYCDNPLGRSQIVGAFTGSGRCVAAFCGVLLPSRFGDRLGLVCRGGDVAIHPDLRRNAAGPRLLLRVCSDFVSSLAGGAVELIFGFPQPGLLRTLVGHCRYEVMTDVLWLTRPTADHVASPHHLQVTVAERVPDDAAALLHACAEQMGTGILRNLDYLRWRYERSPRGDYLFASVRSASGSLSGLAVIRHDDLQTDAVLLTEWLVPRGDEASARALLDATTGVAHHHQRANLVTCFAGSSPEFRSMQRLHGFDVVSSPYQFVYRSFSPRLSRRFLFDSWFLSPGDLDFT